MAKFQNGSTAVLGLWLLAVVGCADGGAATVGNQSSKAPDESQPYQFHAPQQLTTEEGPVRVESPGYASPCWADLDDDGLKDLLVGQFNGGKIRVYKHLGSSKFAPGEWLEAEGKIAQVPGVW